MSLLPGTVVIGGVSSVTVRPDGNDTADVTASNVTGHDLLGGQRVMLTFDDPAGIFVTGIIGGVGGWTDYTPTLSGTGWAIGNGTLQAAQYSVNSDDDMVDLWIVFLFGSTSTAGSASPAWSLPFDLHPDWSFSPWGHGRFRDNSAGINYPSIAFVLSSNVVRFDRLVTSTGNNLIAAATTATNPIPWAVNDRMVVNVRYRRA